jgi:hypothetical protein
VTDTATPDAPGGKTTPFHLRGNYAPVENEVKSLDLPSTGTCRPNCRGGISATEPRVPFGFHGSWFAD